MWGENAGGSQHNETAAGLEGILAGTASNVADPGLSAPARCNKPEGYTTGTRSSVSWSESPDHDESTMDVARGPSQARPGHGGGRLRLRTKSPGSDPAHDAAASYNADGHVVLESKAQMRACGVQSPDRAEALLLALHKP